MMRSMGIMWMRMRTMLVMNDDEDDADHDNDYDDDGDDHHDEDDGDEHDCGEDDEDDELDDQMDRWQLLCSPAAPLLLVLAPLMMVMLMMVMRIMRILTPHLQSRLQIPYKQSVSTSSMRAGSRNHRRAKPCEIHPTDLMYLQRPTGETAIISNWLPPLQQSSCWRCQVTLRACGCWLSSNLYSRFAYTELVAGFADEV